MGKSSVLVFYFANIRHSVQHESIEGHSLLVPLLGRFFLLEETQCEVSFKYILLISSTKEAESLGGEVLRSNSVIRTW